MLFLHLCSISSETDKNDYIHSKYESIYYKLILDFTWTDALYIRTAIEDYWSAVIKDFMGEDNKRKVIGVKAMRKI